MFQSLLLGVPFNSRRTQVDKQQSVAQRWIPSPKQLGRWAPFDLPSILGRFHADQEWQAPWGQVDRYRRLAQLNKPN